MFQQIVKDCQCFLLLGHFFLFFRCRNSNSFPILWTILMKVTLVKWSSVRPAVEGQFCQCPSQQQQEGKAPGTGMSRTLDSGILEFTNVYFTPSHWSNQWAELIKLFTDISALLGDIRILFIVLCVKGDMPPFIAVSYCSCLDPGSKDANILQFWGQPSHTCLDWHWL